jgi:hypothetical protein
MNFFDNNYNDYIKTFISGKFNIDINKLICTRDYNINPWNFPKINNILTPKVLSKIQDKQLFLIVDISYESEYIFVDFLLNRIAIPHNIPTEQLIIIASSKDVENYIMKECDEIGINHPLIVNLMFFERNMKKRLLLDFRDNNENIDDLFKLNTSSISLINGLYKNTNKKYLNLNRLWRPHRIALMMILESENLLDYGYNSFIGKPHLQELSTKKTAEELWHDSLNQVTDRYKDLKDLIIRGQTLKEKLPLILDTSDYKVNHALSSHRKLFKYFNDSWFSVVSETNYLSSQPKFLTEKTFKAISFKHPFILNSTPYSLDFLKDLGYKTFENIIDENYDTEKDDNKRMMLVANEIKRLCNLTEEEVTNFKNNAIPIVEYNLKHFLTEKDYFNRI